MGFFPLYRDSSLTGPSHVSLSVPGKPSDISKMVGGNSPALLLIPNIDFLSEFIKGNLGIADKAMKNEFAKMMNSKFASESEKVFKITAQNCKLNLTDIEKYRTEGGSLKLPTGDPKKLLPDDVKKLTDKVNDINKKIEAENKLGKGGSGQSNRNSNLNLQNDKDLKKSLETKAEDIKKSISDMKIGMPTQLDDFKSAQFKLPLSDISINPEFNGLGFKALEKSVLLSIFETQKPFMEIAKMVLDLMVDSEDIVARIMPILSGNPLTHKSEKPTVNGGTGDRPKAVGFQNGKEIKKNLNLLSNLQKKGGELVINPDGSYEFKNKKPKGEIDGSNSLDTGGDQNSKYELVSVVYSTGVFDPNIEYEYIYINLPADSEPSNDQKDNVDGLNTDQEDEDPFDKWKPKRLIFGLFNSKGVPLNPDNYLTNTTFIGNVKTESKTNFKIAEWIKNSPKWKFKENEYVWPTFGTPNFVFTNGVPFMDKVSKTEPSAPDLLPKYRLKKYEEGDKNIINGRDAIPGDPVIDGFDAVDKSSYSNYFNEYTTVSLKKAKELDDKQRAETAIQILSQLEIKTHLENVYLYGQNRSSVYSNPGFPETMKLSFMPHKIYIPESKSDPNLASMDGMIWIDPEADYDMKVIRVDPVVKKTIASLDPNSEPELDYQIKSFVKNKVTFSLSDNSNFSIKILKNGKIYEDVKETNTYTLDNWNYENNDINNLNYYNYEISFGSNILLSGTISNSTLNNDINGDITGPNLGSEKKLIINKLLKSYTISQNQIPTYQIKVIDNKGGYKILNPNDIKNSELSKDELYSKGRYGAGNLSNPQQIEIIKRFQLTDLDTESYYIIEGIKVSENNQTGDVDGGDGGKWYRLPHAIGAITVFLKFLIKIGAKLIPTIMKIINLLKNPVNFISDIIIEKLGESFTILSEPSMKQFKELIELAKNKEEEIKKQGYKYIEKVKQKIKSTNLINNINIREFGNYDVPKIGNTRLKNSLKGFDQNNVMSSIKKYGDLASNYDGIGLIPFTIFGKDLSFGLETKMFNLAENKAPIRLIFRKPKKSSKKNSDSGNKDNNIGGNPSVSGGGTYPPLKLKEGDLEKRYEIVSIWYSTGEFLKDVEYNYIYVNQESKDLLDEINDLMDNDEDALAKALLNQALNDNPDDQGLKDKLEELDLPEHPLLKLILGLVTTPIKIIADVISWIMDFFKSLTNPTTLPAKIVEFLSFKWIMKFFSPKGVLELMGIKFDPTYIKIKYDELRNTDLPDNFDFLDLTKFFDCPFLNKLPTYTIGNMKYMESIGKKDFPFDIIKPNICFIEKTINGFIDFIWSLLGIEIIIPPPHLKLCFDKNTDDIQKLLNGELPSENDPYTTDVTSTVPFNSNDLNNSFVYEVKMPDGTVKTLLNREELDKFMEENKSLSYDLKF